MLDAFLNDSESISEPENRKKSTLTANNSPKPVNLEEPTTIDPDLQKLEEFVKAARERLNGKAVPRAIFNALNPFHQEAKALLQSDKAIQTKREEIKQLADKYLNAHRHGSRRWLFDLFLTLFFPVGIPVMAIRKVTGHSAFFSNADTKRREDFAHLIDEQGSQHLFKN